MLEQFTVRTFKTLDDVTVDLGMVNVFIGANGSGKRIPPHLFFGARNGQVAYEVSLHNPLREPAPAWRFKTENWKDENGNGLVARVPTQGASTNPERGLAALEAVRLTDGPALDFLTLLQGYAIFSPATAVLRGITPETQPREPAGLSGGGLPGAISELIKQSRKDKHVRRICRDVIGLIDWAKNIGWARAERLPLSSSAAASKDVIRFHDRFMRKDRNVLSGYDASEGALHALMLAVIAGHQASPALCAVDNADQGLNPRLAQSLMERLCTWYLEANTPRQILLTTHNPLVLDGLPLQDDRVRLFTVSRTDSGRTSVRRVVVDDSMMEKAEKGWTLSRLWVMGHLGGVPDV